MGYILRVAWEHARVRGATRMPAHPVDLDSSSGRCLECPKESRGCGAVTPSAVFPCQWYIFRAHSKYEDGYRVRSAQHIISLEQLQPSGAA